MILLENKYQTHSHKSKEIKENLPAEKKVEKVITGTATTKKKGLGKKFADIFIAEDARSVGDFILQDIIVPAAKSLFVDLISGGANMIAYGDRGAAGRRPTSDRYGYGSGYTNYNRMSTRRDTRPVARTTTSYNFDDIYIPTRGEAEAVIARLEEQISEYGTASVNDLYDAVGITGEYTDCKYGWTDLRSARVERARDGSYMLKMPRALPL